MDGWGYSTKNQTNATLLARTPHLDHYFQTCPLALLTANGEAVGLPAGQMGNSEVGHLNLGAGRIVYQEITRIHKAIREKTFFENPALGALMEGVLKRGGALHLMGLVSDGGVHSHLIHLYALLDLAKSRGLKEVWVHAFLDGRDTPPKSGRGYVAQALKAMEEKGIGRITTLSGRYFAMDRDRRWERVQKAYQALIQGEGLRAKDPLAAMDAAYGRGETDEFVKPTVLESANGEVLPRIREEDGVIFFNFRADRARELTQALTQADFPHFARPFILPNGRFVSMTEYDSHYNLPAAFPPVILTQILGEVISRSGVRQLRIAETEKYAHVTYFFNGGVEEPFPGEDRCLIPSPKEVPTYDLKPSMSAFEVTAEMLKRLDSGTYGFVVLNFANPDMVGHTGILEAAIQACETVDQCVGRVVSKVLSLEGQVMLTADHGNAEEMVDANGSPHTAHTVNNPVPCLLIQPEGQKNGLCPHGILADVAPTILNLMNLPVSPEMTGTSLIKHA